MERLSAIVLAGGKSTRFGSDKAAALLEGKPLLRWVLEAAKAVCDDVVVVRAVGQALPDVGMDVRVVQDRYEALGPLAGMVAGFEALRDGAAIVLSCDAPIVRPSLLRALAARLEGQDAACGRLSGRLQPLPGAYDIERCLPTFRARAERGELAVHVALAELGVCELDEPELRAFDPQLASYLNVNTPDDLSLAAAALSAMATEN